MIMQEIPREHWNRFFHSFSCQHEGWLATLEIFATDTGAQQEARDIPFEAISLDKERAESEAVVIDMRTTTTEHISHMIAQPTHVWLQKTEAGADAGLEIQAEDDSRASLRFRSPMPPELVDGVLKEF